MLFKLMQSKFQIFLKNNIILFSIKSAMCNGNICIQIHVVGLIIYNHFTTLTPNGVECIFFILWMIETSRSCFSFIRYLISIQICWIKFQIKFVFQTKILIQSKVLLKFGKHCSRGRRRINFGYFLLYKVWAIFFDIVRSFLDN